MAGVLITARARGLALSSRPFTAHAKYTYKSVHTGTVPSKETSDILSRAEHYLLQVYDRPRFVLSHGKGSYVWDTDGRKYLDFTAGIAVNALGHADEAVAKVMAQQAGKLLHTSNVFHNEWASKLAERLVTLTKEEGGLGFAADSTTNTLGVKVFFSNSGTEANEGALKVARKVGKERWAAASPGRSWDSKECNKTRILCFHNSFHGRSMGALSVTSTTKYQKPFEPLIPDVDVRDLNDIEALESAVTEETCAVIVEPIQGEGGIYTAREDWLRVLRKKCNNVGATLIFDEIQCGLYRTGTLWAHSGLPVDCHPDMITVAKPLANGYPIGAVLVRDSIAATMTVGTHGTTFGGSPLACALGHHVLGRLSDHGFISNIEETGAYLKRQLQQLPELFPGTLLPEIRGRGLILGMGFKNEDYPKRVVSMARERGVLLLTAGKDALRLVPSLIIGRNEVDHVIEVINDCLRNLH